MKKISIWAKRHRLKAVILLIIIKLALLLIAFFIGSSLQEMNFHFPFAVYVIVLLGLLAAVFTYPSRFVNRTCSYNRSKRKFYTRQKSHDLVIAVCSFIMITVLVNKDFTVPVSRSTSASIVSVNTTTPTAEEILNSLQHRDKSTLTKKEKRILKKEFKNQLKVYVKAKISGNKADAGKALLVILAIFAALGLLYLVMALSCSLACNGAEAAAAIVAILGTAAVVVGLVFLIRHIIRGPRRRRDFISKTDISR